MENPTKLKTSAKHTIADQNEKDCFAFAEKINTAKATELTRTEYISVPKIAYPGNRSDKETQLEQNFIRQKYLFYNRSRFKRCLIGAITCLFLVIYPLTACAGETNPTPQEGLPWGVFPLNDVRWVETSSGYIEYTEDNIYIVQSTFITTTYFVKQVGENKAELHSFSEYVIKKLGNDNIGNKVEFPDSAFSTEPGELKGWITVEGKKVYYQRNNPIYSRQVLFDYDVKVGDTLTWLWEFESFGLAPDPSFPIWVVRHIDSTRLGDGENKKQYFVSNSYVYNNGQLVTGIKPFWVVEGIGCLQGLLYTTSSWSIHPDYNTSLKGIYYKDKQIWGNFIWDGEYKNWHQYIDIIGE